MKNKRNSRQISRKRPLGRSWPIFLLWVLLALAACRSHTDEQPPLDQAAPASPVDSIYAYGIVDARYHSTLSAKFPGKIERILVHEGERVKKGQLLAVFEARELTAQVTAAKAGVKVAEAAFAEGEAGFRKQEVQEGAESLAEAQARLAKAQVDWQRAQRLLDAKVIPRTSWEAARLAWQEAAAHANAAQAHLALLREGTRQEALTVLRRKLALARAQQQEAEAALANSRLTAPYAGVITRKHREEGEALDIGMPVLDIATYDNRYVRAEIDETDIGKLKLGQKTLVTADGFPGLEFPGQVTEIKQQMGAKQLIPTDPSKIVDYKVLDVEVSIPPDCPFPLKLPVNVRIAL